MKNATWRRIGYLIIILICVTIGASVAYGKGYYDGMKYTIGFGIKIIQGLYELNKVNFSIDWNVLELGIMQYKHNIGNCLFIQNSTI